MSLENFLKNRNMEPANTFDDSGVIAGTIILRANNAYQVIPINKIVYCVADGSYTTVQLDDGSHFYTSRLLADFERLLEKSTFCRCHKSFLVNCLKVEKLDRKKKLLTASGYQIPISRRKCCLIRAKLNHFNDHF